MFKTVQVWMLLLASHSPEEGYYESPTGFLLIRNKVVPQVTLHKSLEVLTIFLKSFCENHPQARDRRVDKDGGLRQPLSHTWLNLTWDLPSHSDGPATLPAGQVLCVHLGVYHPPRRRELLVSALPSTQCCGPL